MATIEPKRETIIKESFVLTYERHELEAIVANPKPWLRELKAVLDGGSQQPLKRERAQGVKRIAPVRKAKKAKVTAKAIRPTAARTFQCKKCSRAFSSQGRLDQHDRTAHSDVEIGSYRTETAE